MNHRVVVTGAMGLVGSALVSAFSSRNVRASPPVQGARNVRASPPVQGARNVRASPPVQGARNVRASPPVQGARNIQVIPLDIAATGEAYGDVRDAERVKRALHNADGVVHLAAVSRVIWGEKDPEKCFSTNVGGLKNILQNVANSPRRPWLIFASSREVYGQAETLPATENCPLQPVNVYGRSKVSGEQLIMDARQDGIRACTIRLSNVFGATHDHSDRVVPAFARAAAAGQQLRVDGANHTFDFTHITDVVAGITSLVDLLNSGEKPPPPIHFVSGVPTTLGELAAMAIRLAGTHATLREAPPRTFDVEKFWGSPERAERLLGWRPKVHLAEGLSRLITAFRDVHSGTNEEAAS